MSFFRLSFYAGIMLVCFKDPVGLFLVFSLVVFSMYSMIMSAFARNVVCSKVQAEREASSFVSHALKQRFSAVGATVNHLTTTKVNTNMLNLVLQECKVGHDHCHAVSVAKRLNESDRGPKVYSSFLLTELMGTTMGRQLCRHRDLKWPSRVAEVYLEIDWELFHLVMTEWAFMGGALVLVEPDRAKGTVVLQLDRRKKASVTLETLAGALGGMVFWDALQFRARWDDSLPPKQVCVHDVLSELAGLKIAVIDDNLLVRSNVTRALRRYVPIDQLLVRGDTKEECDLFPFELVAQGIDLAIVDLHLDVSEDVSVSGCDVAKRAKLLGFKGCVIIHSSDVYLADLLQEGAPIHSVVEKNPDSQKLLLEFHRCWTEFRAQQIQETA
jgi:hypothetical protein